ncbi:MAG: protein translocase subunit SecF, partial [Syntrophales bacterium]|nr:protein translocase subunit SecF [Syntrophales bacterium]
QNLKDLSQKIEDALNMAYGKGASEIQRVEVVGPKVGSDLKNKAIMALVFSWIGMLIYVAWRFEFRYAVGGILALVHDVIITVGVFSLLNKEFNLTIVAALLTIIGYSINDTIVIFDRIRENARKHLKQDLGDTINASINQTLGRTILTSLTVFIVVAVLFFFGGAVIHDFAFALLVGVVAGTYSTIFIASPIVLAWENIKLSKIKRKK